MASYSSCPNCGAEADGSGGSTWFKVYQCSNCGGYYCHVCGDNDGSACPHENCGSSDYETVGEVYADD